MDPEQRGFWAETIPSGHAAEAARRGPAPRFGLVLLILLLGLVGAFVGLWLAATERFPAPTPPWIKTAYPYPHHVSKYPGGVSLRFAMVHDVLHERFPRHGREYYVERNRLAREALGKAPNLQTADRATQEKYFSLMDDLGVGLDLLGEHDEAVRILRDKLRQQERLGWKGRDLYTTYANLGTSLIHGSFRKVRAGDTGARVPLREGLHHIRESIAVNPQAHFGREEWQAKVVDYLLACVDDPRLLLSEDLTGNRLDEETGSRQAVTSSAKGDGHTRLGERVAAFLQLTPPEQSEAERASCREPITRVGGGEGKQGVPFDEPVLGIIGMWRLGGGANPYFSLALAEIMLRVGQRYIAWCGYERTVLLADAYWPDKAIQAGLKDHCRKRQAVLENQLPPDEVARLRPRFKAELAYGQGYQREYQEYEADRIAAGVSLDDPHFYDAFHKDHKPIASPVGPADTFVVESRAGAGSPETLPAVLLFAGLFAFSGAVCFRILARAAGP